MSSIYLDYNATTPLPPEVFGAMEPFLRGDFGNASSMHNYAREPRRIMRDARRSMAALLGAEDEQTIIFTSGGTESNNAALRSSILATGKRKIITSAIEHSSILKPLLQLEKEGVLIQKLSVNCEGELDLEEFKRCLTPDTALVSLMTANNETGVFLDYEAAARMCKERGVLFHADAVQSIGKEPICLKQSGIDFLSLSGHKIYGPKGIGVLYVKPGAPYIPLISGGTQERGRRGGTENVAGIAGLGKACQLVMADFDDEVIRLSKLREYFENRLKTEFADTEVVGSRGRRLPNTCLMLFHGVDAEALLYALDASGVACSSGSACMSGSREPSHVLTAMGYDRLKALSAIRFSLGRFTRQEELDIVISILKQVLHKLRTKK